METIALIHCAETGQRKLSTNQVRMISTVMGVVGIESLFRQKMRKEQD